jgi:hypothetical protein
MLVLEAKALSNDLRQRVIAGIERGLSCRQAAERFGVSASTFAKDTTKSRMGMTGSCASHVIEHVPDIMAHADILKIVHFLHLPTRKTLTDALVAHRSALKHPSFAQVFGYLYYSAPGVSAQNPHWRNFMSAAIFKHIAVRFAFDVIRQETFSWGEPDINCITVLHRNG